MTRIVDVTEVILRDAHQSLLATRMSTADMVPVCPDLDGAGYWSLECWGGATYDSCIRYLNEDPWDRLRTFRKLLPNSRTQMLLRGQNLLGYRHYEDTVVRIFVQKAAEHGMDVFRVFDALNDLRNIETAVKAVKAAGKHAQGTICYTTSPVHNTQSFVRIAEGLIAMGCDSICIKDMAALLKPQPAYDIVKAIKEKCGAHVKIQVHVHATTGVTLVSLMKAIEAGADGVDTAVSSLALGPGHNPTESLIEMLEGTPYSTNLDLNKIIRVKEHFQKIRPEYDEFASNILGVETEIFKSQIPGGMISNMEGQLKQQGAADKLKEVLEEVPRVREDAGFPPLVTPSSQIVGTQAVFNVMMGRYKAISGEFADLMLGYYGATDAPKNPDVVKLAEASAKKSPIEGRPADLLKPEWDKLASEAKALPGCNGSDEDVLTYAMFPTVAPKFFQTRGQGPKPVSKRPAPQAEKGNGAKQPAEAAPKSISAPVRYLVTVAGQTHKVTVEPGS